MDVDVDPDGQLTPGARRILEVASDLFFRLGIHAVGVDTIAAESGVTKRTLYDRFGSKDALVVAYLNARDRAWRAVVLAALDAAGRDPVGRVLAPFDVLPDWIRRSDRGCSFINAFAELPDPDHPGRRLVVAEKTWLYDVFRAAAAEAGATAPDVLAGQLLSLHEGAIVGQSIVGLASAPVSAREAARVLVERAVAEPAGSTG